MKRKIGGHPGSGTDRSTGHNYQPYRVYVLQSPEALEKIRGLTRCAFNAPVVLMVTVRKDEKWVNPFEHSIRAGEQDASIVATHMMLEAWELGIGSCWVNYFPVSQTADAFGLDLKEVAPAAVRPWATPQKESTPPISTTNGEATRNW